MDARPEIADERDLIDRFHVLWHEEHGRETWRSTSWLGTPVQQCPLDLWIYHELLLSVRPQVFVEVGVKRGGLTRFVADVLRLHRGRWGWRIVGVDLEPRHAERGVRFRRQVTVIGGDSTSPDVFRKVERKCKGKRTMVLLDSDHRAAHVRRELELYASLVSPGSYLIVNDTNINGHPSVVGNKGRGPGPFEAVEDFLGEHPEFERDARCERYLLTLNPNGYLRRRDSAP